MANPDHLPMVPWASRTSVAENNGGDLGFWNEGAGERTARTHAEGIQANEDQRPSNRLHVQDRDLAYKTALADYNHALFVHSQWQTDNSKWQLAEYERECRAADKEERESRYRSADVLLAVIPDTDKASRSLSPTASARTSAVLGAAPRRGQNPDQ